MNAFTVAVDYADLLALTLPYNRHHFERFHVITDRASFAAVDAIARPLNVGVYATNAFYDGGARFNKWKALEEGLDLFGRCGWLCIMDADVLWPKNASERPFYAAARNGLTIGNCLYTPRRRMWEQWPQRLPWMRGDGLPPEADWARFPLHPQQREFAGYSQIFHSADPVLGSPPWHETDWRHAGGADSFFQAKWADGNKVRPPFEVLHLGLAGHNWCGRVTPYADGTIAPQAAERVHAVRRFIRGRQSGPERFRGEKLG